MKAAASRYFLQIRSKNVAEDLVKDERYFYFDTLDQAIDDMIQRKEKAIVMAEQNIKRQASNLKLFKKKYGRL